MNRVAEEAVRAPAAEPRVNGGVKRRLLVIAAVLLLIALGLGIRYVTYWRVYETTDDAFIEGHVVPVSARVAGHVLKVNVTDNQEVKQGQVLVELDGRDYAVKVEQAKAALAAAAGKQQAAESSAAVTRTTAGASLEQAEAGVKLAEAAVQSAESAVESAKIRQVDAAAQLRVAEALSESARAEVVVAESEAERTAREAKRIKEMYAASAASQRELDNASAAAQQAASSLEANRKKATAAEAQVAQAQTGVQVAAQMLKLAESQWNEAQARLGEARAKLASAQSAPQQVLVSEAQAQTARADVEQAKAALEQAELNYSYTRIIAPEDGRVTRKTVEAGQYVQVGQPMLALVPKRVWVVANFKETQLEYMRPGQPVSVHVDAYPDLKITGKVDSIQAGTGARFSLLPPENATGNYVKVVQRVPVKIVLDQQQAAEAPILAPGMSVVPEVKVR